MISVRKSSWKSPFIPVFLLVISAGIHLFSVTAYTQKSISEKDLAMRDYMLNISRQLGVTCNHCHDVKNFKDDKMTTHQISKQHMRVVHLLNTEGFVGKNALKVDCYMCHRGQAKPKYKEEP